MDKVMGTTMSGPHRDKIRFVKRLAREVLSNFVLCLINMYMTRKSASKETMNILKNQ